ncbi:hypothetical protein ACM0L0_02165 [Mycoplasma sp. 005V]|uniref:hypothetical protein n=1 Tax=Mycoplasma sp. 005V TaxID=3398776 RepID=UPI003A8B784A
MRIKNKVLLSILATSAIAIPLVYTAIAFSASAVTKQNNATHIPNAINCCCPGCLRGLTSKTITISSDYKNSNF